MTGDDSHYVAVIMELEARGAKVIPIFAGGLDFSGPVDRYLVDSVTGKPFVHAAVSLTGFALVGGPARQDHPRAIEALRKLDVPYIVALPLVFQTTEEWLLSSLGLHPVQVALQVALPELDGGMEPIVFSGRDARTGNAIKKNLVNFFFPFGLIVCFVCCSLLIEFCCFCFQGSHMHCIREWSNSAQEQSDGQSSRENPKYADIAYLLSKSAFYSICFGK